MVNTFETNPIFVNSIRYQPKYSPTGNIINIVSNKKKPSLPWLFRLPMRKVGAEASQFNYQTSLGTITNFDFRISNNDYKSELVQELSKSNLLSFSAGEQLHLTITMNGSNSKSHTFKSIPLTIKY